jgi:hypothetical protein
LLDREPKESIRERFDIMAISRYLPLPGETILVLAATYAATETPHSRHLAAGCARHQG